jgi:cytochrome bd-type quinol oxidase subunit 2
MRRTHIFLIAAVALGVTLGATALLDGGHVYAETAKEALTAGVSSTGEGDGNLDGVIATVVNVMSLLVSIVSVIMIIFAGFKFVTSTGDSGKTSGARNTIVYAIVGLVVVALAQAIVRFVLIKV